MTEHDVEYDWMSEARQIAAQCWCDEETKHKEMDATLCEAVARRIASWMRTGAQHERNGEYWRKRALTVEASPAPTEHPAPAPAEPIASAHSVYFISAVSGLRYSNRMAAGDVSTIIVNGEPFKIVQELEDEEHPAPAPADDPKYDYRQTTEYMEKMGLPHPRAGVPDGFYLLSREDGTDECLVKVYTPIEPNVKGIGYGMWDGAAFMPMSDLRDGAKLTPVKIVKQEASPATAQVKQSG